MFMKHRHYMKPTIKLVQLRQQRHILVTSTPRSRSSLNDYKVQDYYEE